MRLPPFGLNPRPGTLRNVTALVSVATIEIEDHEPADVAAADEVGPQVLLRPGEPDAQQRHPEDVDATMQVERESRSGRVGWQCGRRSRAA